MNENIINKAKDLISNVPNFPVQGVMFKDISPLLASPVYYELMKEIVNEIKAKNIECDYIAGIESRGFVVGQALASEMQKPFLMIRKANKLPPPKVRTSYKTEYSEDVIEVKAGSGKVVVADDVLATGGTLEASKQVLKEGGYDITGLVCLIDLTFLHGDLNYDYIAPIKY